MKKPGILLIWHCCYLTAVTAQSPQIGVMRSFDNNHALAGDSNDWKFHRIIKEIPLEKNSSNTLLTFGGEIREQLRYYHHVNFGDVDSGVSDKDLYLQQRFMLHTDLRVNRFLRVFAQFNSCHVTGKNSVSPQVDRDDLGLMQAFADLDLHVPFPVKLRLGRQEFLMGQDRILGLRDGPTIRQTFDGARLIVELSHITGTVFLVQPVSYNFGVFDNTWRRKEYVLAGYLTMPLKGNHLLDLYYFGVQFQHSVYANVTANENRHSTGLRISKGKGSFTYDAEFTWQFGQFGKQDIRAWQLSSMFAYHWQELPWNPGLLIRETLYSGDRKQADNIMNTFRPVSTKSPVYDLVQIGSANLALISPEIEISLSKKTTLTIRYLAVWKLSQNDGIYPPDVRKMTRETDMPGKELGKLITKGVTTDFLYVPNKHLSVLIYGGLFNAGNYISNTGVGRNMESFSVRAAYKF